MNSLLWKYHAHTHAYVRVWLLILSFHIYKDFDGFEFEYIDISSNTKKKSCKVITWWKHNVGKWEKNFTKDHMPAKIETKKNQGK